MWGHLSENENRKPVYLHFSPNQKYKAWVCFLCRDDVSSTELLPGRGGVMGSQVQPHDVAGRGLFWHRLWSLSSHIWGIFSYSWFHNSDFSPDSLKLHIISVGTSPIRCILELVYLQFYLFYKGDSTSADLVKILAFVAILLRETKTSTKAAQSPLDSERDYR